jgi:hypothetical protein
VNRVINQYLPSAEDLITIAAYRFNTEQVCIHAAGYTVANVEPPEYPAFVETEVSDRASRTPYFGFFDTTNVTQYGYVRLPAFPGQVSVNADPGGIPLDVAKSCVNAGVNAVSGVLWDELPNGGPKSAVADPRVVAARTAWSECIRQKGIKATTPDELQNAHLTTSAADIAIAVADVNCKISTNYVGIAVGVQNEYDERYIADNQGQLSAYQTSVHELVATAKNATK